MIKVHDVHQTDPETVTSWANHIADNMRDCDVAEIKASSGATPHGALTRGLAYSTHCYVIVSDTEGPIAMFGAAPTGLHGSGSVWMLGTDGIRKEPIGIARETRPYFDILNEAYFLLWNFIDDRNTLSKRWLEWGGFKLLKEHPNYGPEGRTFHSFARTAVCVNPTISNC